jgi:hypothetical protein
MSELMKRAADLMRSVDEFGPLHIIVGDGNVDDIHLEMCVRLAETEDERELLRLLKAMTVDARDELWETAWESQS